MSWKFWKKEDSYGDFKLPSDLGLPRESSGLDLTGNFEAGSANSAFSVPTAPALPPLSQSMNDVHPMGSSSFSPQFAPSSNAFTAPSAYSGHDEEAPRQAPSGHSGKDLEVVSAKLDAIKSQLDMLNLRLSTMEQRMGSNTDQGGPRKPWY